MPNDSNREGLNGFLTGGGDTGDLMRSIDWSKTAVGPVDAWPQSLRTAVSILMESRFPMYIAWGAEYTQFYNDGYRPVLGSTKHPAAMGLGASETFAESWHIIGPMFDGATVIAPARPRPEQAAAIRPRVLVVDDNVDAADLLAESLDLMGYTTRIAHDGPTALEIAAEFKPEVALLDIGLPAMDGYELARLLRGRPDLSRVRLVAVTGYGQEADRRTAESSGFNVHLVKPVDIERLRSIMRQMTSPEAG